MKMTSLAAMTAAVLLMGAGCNRTQNSAYLNPAVDAYGQSALVPPDADGVRANAEAFRQRQNQPVNTIDENGNSQAAVQSESFGYDASDDNGQGAGTQMDASATATVDAPNEPTPTPSMERPTAFPGVLPASEITNKRVSIETNKGTIVFELLGNEGPKAASNFVALAKSGYYDGLTWHRVVPGFVIQGGDPLGTGTGGPGYKFEDDEVNLSYDAGIVAMANAGPNTNGSQFFIVLEDQPSLPPAYSVFGRVIEGMDVVRSIAKGDKMSKITVGDL